MNGNGETQHSEAMPNWRVRDKWGSAVSDGATGFQALPDILVRSQARLGLSAAEMVVLINVLMYWWTPEQWPYPRPRQIANRMGGTTRTAERWLKKLERKGLLRRLPSEENGGGPRIRRIDLTGLIQALQKLAEEFHSHPSASG